MNSRFLIFVIVISVFQFSSMTRAETSAPSLSSSGSSCPSGETDIWGGWRIVMGVGGGSVCGPATTEGSVIFQGLAGFAYDMRHMSHACARQGGIFRPGNTIYDPGPPSQNQCQGRREPYIYQMHTTGYCCRNSTVTTPTPNPRPDLLTDGAKDEWCAYLEGPGSESLSQGGWGVELISGYSSVEHNCTDGVDDALVDYIESREEIENLCEQDGGSFQIIHTNFAGEDDYFQECSLSSTGRATTKITNRGVCCTASGSNSSHGTSTPEPGRSTPLGITRPDFGPLQSIGPAVRGFDKVKFETLTPSTFRIIPRDVERGMPNVGLNRHDNRYGPGSQIQLPALRRAPAPRARSRNRVPSLNRR